MEAQRFPADYDGIVAGAPANNWTRLMAGDFDGVLAVLKDPASHLPLSALGLLHRGVLAACDSADGVSDGVLEDPRQCKFDPGQLTCADNQARGNLPDQAAGGSRAPHLRRAEGSQDWRAAVSGTRARAANLYWPHRDAGQPVSPSRSSHYKWLVFGDPNWDWKTFDFADPADYAAHLKAEAKYAPILNATDPNLRAFRDRGGKLLQYHGWNDQLISAQNSIDYYESALIILRSPRGGRAGVLSTLHGAGNGALQRWNGSEHVRHAGRARAMGRTRRRARSDRRHPRDQRRRGSIASVVSVPEEGGLYKGQGDTNEAASFVCR